MGVSSLPPWVLDLSVFLDERRSGTGRRKRRRAIEIASFKRKRSDAHTHAPASVPAPTLDQSPRGLNGEALRAGRVNTRLNGGSGPSIPVVSVRPKRQNARQMLELASLSFGGTES